MKNTICLVLATVIFGQSVVEARTRAAAAAGGGQEQTQAKPTIKERILEVPPGTMIEVRLAHKQRIRGRLGELTDQGFSLQTAQENKIETMQIAFSEVKSFKKVEGNKSGHALLYALAGIGAFFVALTVWAIARGE